jgi:chromosome segregation ATPase
MELHIPDWATLVTMIVTLLGSIGGLIVSLRTSRKIASEAKKTDAETDQVEVAVATQATALAGQMLDRMAKQVAELEKKLTFVQGVVADNQVKLASYAQEVAALTASNKEKNATIAEQGERIQQLENEVQCRDNRIEQLETEVNELKAELITRDNQIAELNRRMNDLQTGNVV